MSSANKIYYHSNATGMNSTQFPIRIKQFTDLVNVQPSSQSTYWNAIDYSYDRPYGLSITSSSYTLPVNSVSLSQASTPSSADDYLFALTSNQVNSASVSLSWQSQPTDLSESSMQCSTSIISHDLHDSMIGTTMKSSTHQTTENKLPSLKSTNVRKRRKKSASSPRILMKRRIECKCPNCDVKGGNKTFSSYGRLQHACHIPGCGKQFDWPSFLEIHLRKHGDNRPYSCTLPMCEKKFKSKEELVRHTRVHTGEKNFACPHCKSKFQRSDHLDKHEKSCTKKRKKSQWY